MLRARRLPLVTLIIVGAGVTVACTLLVDSSGLSGEPSSVDAATDTTVAADALTDTSTTLDAGTDAIVGDGSPCMRPNTDPSLVLYLPFDEDSVTTAFDCSGRGHDARFTLFGDAGRAPGHVGGALRFDGEQTCLELGITSDLVLQGDFTIATWALVTEFQTPAPDNNSRTILSKTTSSLTRGWRFSTDDLPTSVGFKIGTPDAGTFSAMATPVPATWVHIAGVWRSGASAEIWLNGLLAKTTNPIVPIVEDSQPVLVGCVKAKQAFKGMLDELRIYNRALTGTEIAALAQ